MLDIERIQALCFDLDGTLCDTDDYYAHAFTAGLRHIPRTLLHEPDKLARRLVMWTESPGSALLSLSDTLGLDGPLIRAIDVFSRQRRRKGRQYLIVPGVGQMLSRLKSHYPMAVVSARDEAGTLAFLRQFDLIDCFRVIVSALSAQHTKPYADPILLAARRLGVAPEACVLIGDTTLDIRAGKAAGAQTVAVLCGFGEEGELRRQNPDLLLPSTADLATVLLGKQ